MPFEIERGSSEDVPRLLALFDDAVRWLVARGQTAQWGSEPWSERPPAVERARGWARDDRLWFATAGGADAGALVLGQAPDYVPPADRPEAYVIVLLTAARFRGQGVGARLIEHARSVAREDGAERLRVDCWAGVPDLPRQYERLGFTRIGSFSVGDWPGAVLALDL